MTLITAAVDGAQELLTTFSGIQARISCLFLAADATQAAPDPSKSPLGRQSHAAPATLNGPIPGSQPNPPLG
jgi:hypothetical protein